MAHNAYIANALFAGVNLVEKYGVGRILYFIHVVQVSLGLGFVPLFFREQGIALHSIIMLYAISAGVASLSIPLVSRMSTRRTLFLGIGTVMALSFVLLLDPALSFWLFGILQGLSMVFFWIPHNYLFFHNSKKHAGDSSLLLIIPGIMGMMLPHVGALLIGFNYKLLFICTGLISIASFICAFRFAPEHTYEEDFYTSVRSYASLRTITVLEGGLHYFKGVVIPIFTLLYISSEVGFGTFLSYLSLVALIPMFYLAKHSDDKQFRTVFLVPLFLLTAVVVCMLGFSVSTIVWVVLVGVLVILDTISWPLRLALTMDVKEKTIGFWRTREFFLNVGRVVLLSFASILLFFDFRIAVFGMFAFLILLYALLLKIRFAHK